MVICPDCGMEVPDAKFCKNCGASLADAIKAAEESSNEVEVEDEAIPVGVKQEEDSSSEVEVVEAEVIPAVVKNAEDDKGSKKVRFCPSCGYDLNGTFRFCPNCGYDLENKTKVNNSSSTHAVQKHEEKEIIISFVLSFIFPGLGHIYLGLTRKGILFILLYIISAILIFLLIGFVLVFVIWIWALVDTIKSTNAINRGEYVEDKLF